ncbi:phage tail assembly chaperone [Cupriavidus sp. OTU4054]|uniref:phage tail assembly chaperone n=1 Tax=unclassified Cupriavidus TaxID=2640874 RepID=UPI00406C3FDE
MTAEIVAYAEHHAALDKRLKDGSTVRENLESVARQTGRRPEGLDGPALPAAGFQVWQWFMDLNSARPAGLALSPISFSDMKAFFDLIGERPEGWQLAAIRRLDRAVLAAATKD